MIRLALAAAAALSAGVLAGCGRGERTSQPTAVAPSAPSLAATPTPHAADASAAPAVAAAETSTTLARDASPATSDGAPVAPSGGDASADRANTAPAREPAATPAATDRAAPEGMLLVPGGTFVMGSDQGGEGDEHPAHRVTVAPFYLDRTEVTNEAWSRCVAVRRCPEPDPASAATNHLGSDRQFRGAQQPVSSVSWDAARAYCQWLGRRLPTEAEFERAVRGDDGRRYPWGNDHPTPDHAVFRSDVTQDVGTHPRGAGPYGHMDLAGNVWEWLEDVYDPYAYSRPGADRGVPGTCEQTLAAFNELRARHMQGFTGTNPIPRECERVLRGGAFNYDWFGLRSTNRVHHPGRFHLVMSGLRCARDAR